MRDSRYTLSLLFGLGIAAVSVAIPQYWPTFPHWITNSLLIIGALLIVVPLILALMSKKRPTGNSISGLTIQTSGPFAQGSTAIRAGKGVDLATDEVRIRGFGQGIVHEGEGQLDLKRTDIDRESRPYEGVSRNDPCPCGSGKKFKKCHGKNI